MNREENIFEDDIDDFFRFSSQEERDNFSFENLMNYIKENNSIERNKEIENERNNLRKIFYEMII